MLGHCIAVKQVLNDATNKRQSGEASAKNIKSYYKFLMDAVKPESMMHI
jgi:hypothetical protein